MTMNIMTMTIIMAMNTLTITNITIMNMNMNMSTNTTTNMNMSTDTITTTTTTSIITGKAVPAVMTTMITTPTKSSPAGVRKRRTNTRRMNSQMLSRNSISA